MILDPVGASYLADNLASLRTDGRLVLIGLMGGIKAEIPLATVLMKRLRLIGSTLRARSIAAKAAVMDGLEIHLWPKLESGAVKPVIEAVMPMADAQKAHDLVASNQTFGKVVLEW